MWTQFQIDFAAYVFSVGLNSMLFVAGSNNKKKGIYPDDLKIAIYLDLLKRTDPPILRRGVSKAVSEKFDVPLNSCAVHLEK
jgi:hypothetical protein